MMKKDIVPLTKLRLYHSVQSPKAVQRSVQLGEKTREQDEVADGPNLSHQRGVAKLHTGVKACLLTFVQRTRQAKPAKLPRAVPS
jgi:hypothetical protein